MSLRHIARVDPFAAKRRVKRRELGVHGLFLRAHQVVKQVKLVWRREARWHRGGGRAAWSTLLERADLWRSARLRSLQRC